MKNPIARSLLLALLPGALLAGCLGPRTLTPVAHYVLAPAPEVAPAAPGSHTLGLRPLATARPYTLAMAHLDAHGRLAYRENEEWTEAPSAVVTRALLDALAAGGRFADVGDAADMARPDFLLTGEIRAFHEDRGAAPPEAVLSMRLELRPARDSGVVWAETLDARVPLAGGQAADLAGAMSAAVADAVGRAVAAINAADLPES
jgi:ABC-type uncharacterized transport system auxiliary subunit